MAYRIAGIDVHKKMVAVAVADVEVVGTWRFERRQIGTSPSQLRELAAWLVEREVEDVVMESTAQYWRPVWETLERAWQPRTRQKAGAGTRAGALHVAQAQSHEGPRGRIFRTRGDARQALESRRRSARASARRMLRAVANGETDPGAVVAPGSRRLHATPDQLRDALGACTDLHPVYRRLLTLTLDELEVIERHIHQLDEELALLLRDHQDAVERLAAVPGLGVDSAQQILIEVGPPAATFPTAKRLASWVGARPGHDESAGINHSHRAPNGNRQMRRLLNQAANSAVKAKGSIFALVYRRLVVRLGHAQAIGAIAHRLCRLGMEEPARRRHVRGTWTGGHQHRAQRRAAKMIRELRALGYRVEPLPPPASALA